MSPPRLGIALGSGSARGWAHIGALEALLARGLRPAVLAGASVGALVGGACAAGRLDALGSWVRGLTQREVWHLVDATFRGGGMMNGNRLMDAIRLQIGDPDIESLPVGFAAVAADLYTGEEIWIRRGPIMSAIRASSGLPGLFAPRSFQGRWLIDGGVVNPVPVSLCRAMGADVVIAIDLSRSVTRNSRRVHANSRREEPDGDPDSPQKEPETSAEIAAILKRWYGLVDGLVESFRSRRNEPGLFEAMSGSINIMQDRITRSRLASDPPDLVLRPDLADFQLMDFHRAAEAIELGRACVEAVAPQLEPVLQALDAAGGASGAAATR
ncbi:MAG TPA: patatin-like phospholipase family protein [Steroidobacteraceae bacterium]|nr:patatin-like phospholipase family protein [Steroidobacteraceae bacterium]